MNALEISILFQVVASLEKEVLANLISTTDFSGKILQIIVVFQNSFYSLSIVVYQNAINWIVILKYIVHTRHLFESQNTSIHLFIVYKPINLSYAKQHTQHTHNSHTYLMAVFCTIS